MNNHWQQLRGGWVNKSKPFLLVCIYSFLFPSKLQSTCNRYFSYLSSRCLSSGPCDMTPCLAFSSLLESEIILTTSVLL